MSRGNELVVVIGDPATHGYGLTKRELFAVMAMQGFISTPGKGPTPEIIVQASVEMADGLLAALEAPPKEDRHGN